MIRLAAFMALFAAPAFAHEWYAPACCSDEDCARIPVSSVSATPDGWLITLEPGEHLMVDRPMTFLKRYDDTIKSQDGDWHACILKNSKAIICLYAPDMGS